MRRRKLGTTVQVGLRIREELRRQLEATAKAHHRSLNQEATARLEDSLEGTQSLAGFRADWLRRLRDAIERAHKEDPARAVRIEDAWKCLQRLDAKFTKFYTEVEDELRDYVPDYEVRELLRGTPALPDETKSKPKSKSTQQE